MLLNNRSQWARYSCSYICCQVCFLKDATHIYYMDINPSETLYLCLSNLSFLVDDSNSVFKLTNINSNIKVHKTFLSSRLNHISLSFRIICYWNVKALFNLLAIKRKAVCLSMEYDSQSCINIKQDNGIY